MTQLVYPPRFQRKVLAHEAPGGKAAKVDLVIPTITAPGRPFDLKAAVLDELGYPSPAFDGSLRILGPSGSSELIAVKSPQEPPALFAVKGATIGEPGFHRFGAQLAGGTFYSNPTFCTETPSTGIYWGDPHVHTVLSDCHPDKCRSLNFCYSAARYLTGLDWAAGADHVSNGRCELARWKAQCAACDAYDDPPEFVTLGAYEASLKSGAGGDNNVYLAGPLDMFVDEYEEGTVKTLCEKLGEKLRPGEFFVVPHHTTRTGKHGEISDEIYPGEDLMPVVEIHSKWGTSEYRGNPNPLKDVHKGPCYVQDLLARGLRLGLIAGTDTHATMPSGGGVEPGHIDRLPGLTAVRCKSLTRREIFDGIRTRNCYATSVERIYLDVSVSGSPGGRSLAWAGAPAARDIKISAAGRSDIKKIEIVRNGDVIHTHAPQGWHETFSFSDPADLKAVCLESNYLGRFVYYYVRVTCASGAQAWSSPVWLTARRDKSG